MNLEKLQQLAEAEVARITASLPHEVRKAVDRLPVFFEARPDPEDISGGIAPDTLGFYDEGQAGTSIPRVRLWLANLWDYSEADEELFRDEVGTTFLHEVGHFLGWDEDDLEIRNLD